jgi:uncharacterized protein YggU (UPF0235/DUF167 family)
MNTRRNFQFHSEKSGAALTIQVIPGAKKSKIARIRPDGCVIVHLEHAASDERCHPTLVKFLASKFSVDPTQFEIIAGVASDVKIISVLGLDSARADELIQNQLKKKR